MRSWLEVLILWCLQLNPEVKKEPFSAEEEAIIVEKHQEYGNKWAQIAKYLPGRTDNVSTGRQHASSLY